MSSSTAAAAALLPLPPVHRRQLARYLLLGAGGAGAAYAAYRVYNSEGLAEARRLSTRLRAALAAYADAFGSGAAALQLLAADLHAYLASDRVEVPPSLRQLGRLMQSPEAAGATSATVAALLRGVTSGGPSGLLEDGHAASPTAPAPPQRGPPPKPALDRLLDALLSDRGLSLVSVAVSVGARNCVATYCESRHALGAADRAARGGPQPDLTNRLLDFLASPRGQQLAVLSVSAFVTSGVRCYLDQTLELNFYEDLFAAISKPEHLAAVKAVVGVFARDVVGSYLAGPQPHQLEPPGIGLRLSASVQELLARGGRPAEAAQQQAAQQGGEGGADTGSPCSSSVSGSWQAQAAAAAAAAPAGPGGSDVDSDVLLHARPAAAAAVAKAGGGGASDSARSHDVWAVRTPPPAGEAARVPALPALRRVQAAEAAASGAVMQRSGSGNLEWISAVSKEVLAVAQHPQGRSVMVELAGTAAKEAAAGVSAALADRFRAEWLLVAAVAVLVMAALAQRLLSLLLG